jgi:hypothetical protein
MNNINIIGTFAEYMDSIAAEIKQHTPKNYSVGVRDDSWGTAHAEDGGTPCKVICISEDSGGPRNHFSIAEIEFATLQQYAPEALDVLVAERLAATINSLKGLRDDFSGAINKLEVAL